MVYRFEHDGSGKVVSEARRSDLESFLGQYFPASDIPQQARVLYLRNTIRIIADSDGKRIPIEPVLDASGEPLDLSFAHLRSVSPIHCEYLRNMGVAASMSISVIVGGELWGLIACHHYSPARSCRWGCAWRPRYSASSSRSTSTHCSSAASSRQRPTARRALDLHPEAGLPSADVGETLRASLADLRQLVPCDGVGLWIERHAGRAHGSAPPAEAIPSIARFVGQRRRRPDLGDPRAVPSSSPCRGIPRHGRPAFSPCRCRRSRATTCSSSARSRSRRSNGPATGKVLRGRPARRPAHPAQELRHLEADRPRASPCPGPKPTGKSPRLPGSPWPRWCSATARCWPTSGPSRDPPAHAERGAQPPGQEHPRDHQVPGRAPGRRRGATLRIMSRRCRAAFRPWRSLTTRWRGGGGGGSLADLLDAELTPYRDTPRRSCSRARRFGSMRAPIRSWRSCCTNLCTNAAKYGALSKAGGQLSVAWSLAPEGGCRIEWRESAARSSHRRSARASAPF